MSDIHASCERTIMAQYDRIEVVKAERDAVRADADRLADAVNFAIAHSAGMYPGALDYLRQASAAHDATRAKEGPNGFAIEDLCDADD